MKMKIEENETTNPRTWITKHLHCDGLEPHNKSLDLIDEAINDVGATFDIGGENSSHRSEHSFAIRLRGTSGVLYRISVHYRPRFARLIADRFHEIELLENDDLNILMRPFRYVMNFDIHWYDDRDGTWEHICIHGRRDRPILHWPGDELVTTLHTLSDDLRHAVMNREMNTLRGEICKSYMISWCGGHTPSDVKFSDVTNYIRHISSMQNASKDDFTAAHNAAMLEIYGIIPMWSPGELE